MLLVVAFGETSEVKKTPLIKLALLDVDTFRDFVEPEDSSSSLFVQKRVQGGEYIQPRNWRKMDYSIQDSF